MKIITIDDTAYKVTEKTFTDIQDIRCSTADEDRNEMLLNDFFDENKHTFTEIGQIEMSWTMV